MFNFIKKINNIQFPFISSLEVYFDLGTSNTRIAIKDKGFVLKEPTYLGYNTKIKNYIFFGHEAKNILGKTPEFIKIIRPLVNGIISDFDAEVFLISHFIEKAVYPYLSQYKFLKPNIHAFALYPQSATEIEQKAVEEVLLKAGCSSVNLIEKSVANAAGCGFDIFSHQPVMVIDLGGGIIEISITSGGGIVAQKTLKNAGESMDKIIANYLYLKNGLILGEASMENLKIRLLNFSNEEKILTVRGKSLENGLPKSIKIKTSDIREALLNNFNQIIDSAKELLEISPPEIVDEVYNRGIFLIGGMASINGIDHFFSQELKIKTLIPENYADASLKGLVNLAKKPENISRLIG
ncbi:MAG: rod shape-determining protein [Microgenomates group bacterium]|nr:rod shape-determining protein [Microgenomates group bacterium]